MRNRLLIIKENEPWKYVASFDDARQAIEDDAVDAWDRSVDPNQRPVAYPGLEWDINAQDDAFAWLHFPEGGLIEYSIVDPWPFAAWAFCNSEDPCGETADCVIVSYDNKGCDYEHSQELMIWLG